MNVQAINAPLPYVSFENIFTESELRAIHAELDSYVDKKGLFVKQLGSAHKDGRLLKENKGFFLNQHVPDPKDSVLASTVLERLLKPGTAFPADSAFFAEPTFALHTMMISHYEEGDYYLPHRDVNLATLLIWLYDEPKSFSGGAFSFTDYPEVHLPQRSNCGVLFPGRYRHEVTELTSCAGRGRFVASLFFDDELTLRSLAR